VASGSVSRMSWMATSSSEITLAEVDAGVGNEVFPNPGSRGNVNTIGKVLRGFLDDLVDGVDFV